MFWLWLACARTEPAVDAPTALRSRGVLAVVSPSAGGCGGGATTVEMYGPSWTTGGPVPAEVEHTPEGVSWLRFPISTGLGDGSLVLRLQGEDAVIPFGARPGEFSLTLARSDDLPDEAERAAAAEAAAAAVEREASAWREGRFLLKDRASTVGEIRFHGEGPPMVSVHDVSWLTPEPVAARRKDDGGDLLLQFPVEPALESEEALLRVNLLSRQVVVPTGPVPDPVVDRRLLLVPGALTAPQRAAAVEAAVAEADAMEEAFLAEQLPLLVQASREAGCAPLAQLGPPWTLNFKGYDVEIVKRNEESCVALAVPELEQHRRRITRSSED